MDGAFDSLQVVVVEGGDAACDEECGVNECETGVWAGGKGVSERVFRREIVEEGKGMQTDMAKDGDGSGKDEILERREMEGRTDAKVFV